MPVSKSVRQYIYILHKCRVPKHWQTCNQLSLISDARSAWHLFSESEHSPLRFIQNTTVHHCHVSISNTRLVVVHTYTSLSSNLKELQYVPCSFHLPYNMSNLRWLLHTSREACPTHNTNPAPLASITQMNDDRGSDAAPLGNRSHCGL